jgi:hypothetical protein
LVSAPAVNKAADAGTTSSALRRDRVNMFPRCDYFVILR